MSNLIPREFINEVLARCDIVEVIDAQVPLRKKGSNHSACCPFHDEKTPSFTVSASKQFYHCFGCGASGNAISFLMEYGHLSFVEAVEELAKKLGMTVPRQAIANNTHSVSPDLYVLMEQVAHFYQQQLRENKTAIDYLKKRGLTGQIAKEFGVGYAPQSWDKLFQQFAKTEEGIKQLLAAGLIIKKTEGGYYDRFRDRIMFPIRDRRGRVIAFGGRILSTGEPKYLNSPETPIFHKGNELYGLFEACRAMRELPRILVVEGYMDVIALAQYDIRNVIATLGTATTAEHIQRLFRLTPEIIFCFDGDRAGQAAAWRALEVVLPLLQDGLQVRFLLLPEGEDPDSLVRKEGLEKFSQQMIQASSLGDFLFATLLKELDLSRAEDKARLAKLAMPYIYKLPEGVYQHMMFERLAQLVRMDIKTLKDVAKWKPKTASKGASSSKLNKSTTARRSPMRSAIALLLQHPNLVQSLTNAEAVFNLQLPGSQLLIELIALLQNSTDLSTGALIEYWRDRPEKGQVMQLAGWEIGIPLVGLESEFLGVVDRLLQLNRELEVEQFLMKANQGVLTDAEKVQLQKLIAATKMISS